MKIIFTGGGTGGHVFPIVAIARELKKIRPDFVFYYIGPKDEFASFHLKREGIKMKWILAGKIRRYWSKESLFLNLLDLIKIPIGFLQSFFYVFFLLPDLIFSKGGYGSIPVSMMGPLFLTPVMVHESDAVPGFANNLVSKFALEVFVSFPVDKTKHFPKKKIISVGSPIRNDIIGGSFEEAKEVFGVKEGKPVVLVLGGSQGSQKINSTILDGLTDFLNNFQIIHQVGQDNFKEVEAGAKVMASGHLMPNYSISPFLREREMKLALAASDIIISRAGGGAIFEIAASGKPSILVPLPFSAQNHQVENAYAYEASGACVVVEEKNLAPHFIIEKLKYLLADEKGLKKMSQAAKGFSRPRAAEIIAKYVSEYLVF